MCWYRLNILGMDIFWIAITVIDRIDNKTQKVDPNSEISYQKIMKWLKR